MRVTIDEGLKAKWPRTALVCVMAQVEVGATPESLFAEMRALEENILRLPEPRACLNRRKSRRPVRHTKLWEKIPHDIADRRRHCCDASSLGRACRKLTRSST